MKKILKVVSCFCILIFSLINVNVSSTHKPIVKASEATPYSGRLTGVNWFGFETSNYVVHGLWSRDYKSVLKQIKDLGFNCVRLPWCNDMFGKEPKSVQVNEYSTDPYTKQSGMNLDLKGLDALGVMDKIIAEANKLGLMIILDNHSKQADGYMNETLWYTSKTSEAKWIEDWKFLADHYKNYKNVVAYDLKNEPHGNLDKGMKPPASWGYNVPGYGTTDWKAAAEKCGAELLKVKPDALIIVEGVESYKNENYWWGGNLKGVKDYPITQIAKPNLMYSPHEYGPEVSNQPWFSDPTFPNNMPKIWDDNFWFIQKQNIAPIFIGEFGIKEESAANPNSVPHKWLKTLMEHVGKKSSWTFWAINPNSGDTGGLLGDDWVTVNPAKYNMLKPYLEPITNSPTDPNKPTDPTDPNKPTDPTDPNKPTDPTKPTVSNIKIESYNKDKSSSINTISENLKVTNTGTSDINLSDLKLRYYLTADNQASQNFWCDSSQLSNNTQITSNVKGNFVKLTTPKPTADYYVEISFDSKTPKLSPNNSVELQCRFTKSDWSNFIQANDYSFNANATAYVDWNKITGYVNGELKYGIEP